MKKNTFYLALYLIVGSLLFISCDNSTEEKTSNKKAKIVELTEENTKNESETSLKQVEKIAEEISEPKNVDEENSKVFSFDGEFVDASILDMSYYYFFKGVDGKELSFYYNPQENSLKQDIPFLLTDLSVNKELIGKQFRIKYTTESRDDDYTGELTSFNIPIDIQEIK